MATYYAAKAFADFKTAYLQREVVLDVVGVASETMTVGQIFSMSGSQINPLVVGSGADASTVISSVLASVTTGMFIVAQGDQTMEYGHVPVEYADYKYDPTVYLTSGGHKKVAAFMITNLADLNLSATAYSYSA